MVGVAKRARSRGAAAFTLIEVLVVLGIIAMILALAVPATIDMLKSTRMIATTDVLAAAVSRTRSTSIASGRSCSLDVSLSEGTEATERVTSSSLLVADDFERYGVGTGHFQDLKDHDWHFWPEEAWQIIGGNTRELKATRANKDASAYAWTGAPTIEDPAIDAEVEVQARFKLANVRSRDEWGFGLVVNFVQNVTQKKCLGYRLSVVGLTRDDGWNKYCLAKLQKIYSPHSGARDPVINPDAGAGVYVIDSEDDGLTYTAAITPEVWYRMKLGMKREKRIVVLSGKVWPDGGPEPDNDNAVFVSACEQFEGGALPEGKSDDFPQEPVSGGYCGAWAFRCDVAVDDFSVDKREMWILPSGIQVQAVKPRLGVNVGDASFDASKDLVPVATGRAGGFPLAFRPDGTIAAYQPVLVRVADANSVNVRFLRIDPNTGRVQAADEL